MTATHIPTENHMETIIDTSNASPELFASFLSAQAEIENATKNANNPFHKSKYADLNEVLAVVKPAFVKHKLGFMQFPSFDGSLASITTLLADDKGAFITFITSCTPAKSDAQGIGAASTYLRRYALAGLAGIYQEDDDGNSAMHDRKPTPAKRKAEPQLKTPSPRAKMMSEFRSDMIKEGRAAGVVPTDDKEALAWANELIKGQAKATNCDLKQIDAWSDDDYGRLTDAAMKAFYDLRDAKSEPEATNA